MNNIQPTPLNEQNKFNNFHHHNQQDFIQILASAGVDNIPSIEIKPNQFQRFGKDKKYSVSYDGNFGYFKDWSSQIPDILWFFDTIKKELSFEERQKLNQQIALEKKQRESELSNQYEEASIKANQVWDGLSTSGTSIYLQNKNLTAIEGVKFGGDANGNLIATALVDNSGKIWSLQFIYDNKFKKFLSDGKMKGCYSEFGNKQSSNIFVCEGLATGLSILLVRPDCLVVVAYNCGNLKEVAGNIKTKYPQKKIVIAGDNDLSKPNNIGKEKAEEAARELGLDVVLPAFKDISTKPSDFDDLRQLEGVGEVKKQLNNLTNTIDLIEWEAPILFDNFDTKEIPADILPSPLKEFAKALSKSTETPEAMALMSVVAVLSTTLQGKFEVKPRENGDHKETLNIYTLTALPPANRKSAILKSCTYPLQEWEKEQKEILEPEIRKQKSRYESEKKVIEAMRKDLKSDGNNYDLIEKISNKESELKEPQALPRLFVNDTTPESLAIMVAEQNNRMSVFSDEGGIVETMAGLYSGGSANIDILLKGWDGGHLRQKRKDRDLDIEPLLTINLVVQPVIIQNLGSKKAYAGKGLLERFLYCLPKSNLGYRSNEQEAMTTQVKNNYNHKIRDLLNIPYQKDPIILSLDDEAFKEWREFQNTIELDLRPEGRLSICQGWGGKICGHALRIAGLFHITEYGKDNTKINIGTIQKALELCSLLTYHAIAAFGAMEVDPDTKDAKEILRWIEACQLDYFPKADLTKKMQNRASMNAARLDKLLSILSQRNIISDPIREGKKTIQFKVNPAISKKWRDK
jgi:phage/plasmid primase-like uncharacterized protein